MKKEKKIMTICLFLLSMLIFSGCDQVTNQEIKSVYLDTVNSEQVRTIKDFELDNGYRLGDLIDAGLGAPTYELLDPAEDGNTYITISGNVLYNNQEIVVGLQYKRIDASNGQENYEFYTIVYNDIPQNGLEAVNFFTYLVDNYESKQVAETTEASTEASTVASKVKIIESTQPQTTQPQATEPPVSEALETDFTVTDWIVYNTPGDWNYSYDDNWGTITLLDANGMNITIDEFYSEASVDAICAAEGLDLSGYENIEIDLSTDYLAHNPPATYSVMQINDSFEALYVSNGGDGNFYTVIYIPEGDKIVKLTILENMWDANFTSEYEEEVLLKLDDILTSL